MSNAALQTLIEQAFEDRAAIDAGTQATFATPSRRR